MYLWCERLLEESNGMSWNPTYAEHASETQAQFLIFEFASRRYTVQSGICPVRIAHPPKSIYIPFRSQSQSCPSHPPIHIPLYEGGNSPPSFVSPTGRFGSFPPPEFKKLK
jgi:hypothetical protein